jgi:Putative beta-barrel porin-2, OmpL-like. bbp2
MKVFKYLSVVTVVLMMLFGRKQTLAQAKDSFAIQVYGEVYASSIPNKPFNKTRPAFHYNYTKANNAGVNIALARVHYSNQKFRTNFGLMAGDYPTANLANEEPWARMIYEANAGVNLSKKKDLWLDAGIMPSHIGFETAIGRDNWSATRSIVADNSPYYETGLRLSYQPNAKWYVAALMLTGWQRITFPRNKFEPDFGTQITFKPSSKISINYSSFIGKTPSAFSNAKRYYSNLFATIQLHSKIAAQFGWDIGSEYRPTGISNNAVWNAWCVQLQYKLVPDKWQLTARYERFIDRRTVLFELPAQIYHQFNVHHTSVNIDRFLGKGFLLRAEANYQSSPYPIFRENTQLARRQFSAFLIASYNFQYSKKR